MEATIKTPNISKIERLASVVAGIGLAASGINHMLKSPCLFLVKCMAGYHLIQIGKTGHSPVNDWLEVNTAGQSPRQAFETYKENFTQAFAAEEEVVIQP